MKKYINKSETVYNTVTNEVYNNIDYLNINLLNRTVELHFKTNIPPIMGNLFTFGIDYLYGEEHSPIGLYYSFDEFVKDENFKEINEDICKDILKCRPYEHGFNHPQMHNASWVSVLYLFMGPLMTIQEVKQNITGDLFANIAGEDITLSQLKRIYDIYVSMKPYFKILNYIESKQ